MSYETILKQFLLAAVNEPQVQLFKTNKQAHKARFALYDALRKLRKAGDRFGEMKDVLEFVVRPTMDGRNMWELRVQPKSYNIMEVLGGWKPPEEKGYNVPPVAYPTPAPTFLGELREQLSRESPVAVEKADPHALRMLNSADIFNWVEDISDRVGQDQFILIDVARKELASTGISLDEFIAELVRRDLWPPKAKAITPPE
jgi:hypothetical protein